MEEYKIKTVDDFLQLPVDRIHDCLDEFAAMLVATKTASIALVDLCESLGQKVEGSALRIPMFTWIDDGKKDQTFNVR